MDVDLDQGTTMNKKIRNSQLAQYNFIFGMFLIFATPLRCSHTFKVCLSNILSAQDHQILSNIFIHTVQSRFLKDI